MTNFNPKNFQSSCHNILSSQQKKLSHQNFLFSVQGSNGIFETDILTKSNLSRLKVSKNLSIVMEIWFNSVFNNYIYILIKIFSNLSYKCVKKDTSCPL